MAKRKEQSRATSRIDGKFTCTNSSCSFVFPQPIRLRNLCEGTEIYDACPRCLTPVTEVANVPTIEVESSEIIDAKKNEPLQCEPLKVETDTESPSTGKQCPHGFGYLSERGKDQRIPDDCMMCENIVKCMTKGMTT